MNFLKWLFKCLSYLVQAYLALLLIVYYFSAFGLIFIVVLMIDYDLQFAWLFIPWVLQMYFLDKKLDLFGDHWN